MKRKPLLSVVIPAHNEEMNITPVIKGIAEKLAFESIPYEIIVVNDASKDKTANIVQALQKKNRGIKLINRSAPPGFGRAIRAGVEDFSGEIVAIVMADLSDDPEDLVRYYRLIAEEGFDAVFGSRFIRGGKVTGYPKGKLLANRIVNKVLQVMFWTRHNDLTNAFKAYRADVLRSVLPLKGAHFNVTIELSLSVLIRGYRIAECPIRWYGHRWGQSNLNLRSMGRRYLATLIKIWFERLLILDDIMAENSRVK